MKTPDVQPGDELRWPHCPRWHRLFLKHTPGTDTGVTMLYFRCGALTYFGGHIGAGGRHATRKVTRDED